MRENPTGAGSPKPAADRHQIFEQVALERLQIGSENSKPVGFLSLPVRFSVVSAVVITSFGVLWACFARVPVQVNGVASISPETQVSSALARVNGILAFQVSGLGPNRLSPLQVQTNQNLTRFWKAAVVNNDATQGYSVLTALALSAMAPSPGQRLMMLEYTDMQDRLDNLDFNKAAYKSLHYKNGDIIARIDNPGAMEELDSVRRVTFPSLRNNKLIAKDREERSNQFVGISNLLTLQRQVQTKELDDREGLFQRLQLLWSRGFVSTAHLLQEQATINGLKNQLLQLDREILNTQFNRNDQRQQVDQSILNNLQAQNQLQNALVAYMGGVYTITPPSGMYIVSRTIRNGMQVRAGDELFTYSVEKPTLPRIIPVFVDAGTSQQLNEGMQVLVTPRGISRAQYGGIPGVVEEVGKLPIPAEGITSFAGGRNLAQTIQQNITGAYLVRVKLQQAEPAYCEQMLSLRCYRWSTKQRPPFPVRLGTLADVQINVQYRRPIEFVMPALRQALGLVVENR